MKGIAVLVVGLCVGASIVPAFAKTETLTGEVISLSCYLQNKANVGRAGMVCAIATVKNEGNPAGLLTADGKVYQITGGLVANNPAAVTLGEAKKVYHSEAVAYLILSLGTGYGNHATPAGRHKTNDCYRRRRSRPVFREHSFCAARSEEIC